MRDLNWHIHKGNPCEVCRCSFEREEPADPQVARMAARQEAFRKAEAYVQRVEDRLEELREDVRGAEDELYHAKRELRRLQAGGEPREVDPPKDMLRKLEEHPWMQARPAARKAVRA